MLIDGIACDLLAVGPLGTLGLTVARASSRTGIYELELPDAGSWALNAECRGEVYQIEPALIVLPPDGQPPAVDGFIVRSRGE